MSWRVTQAVALGFLLAGIGLVGAGLGIEIWNSSESFGLRVVLMGLLIALFGGICGLLDNVIRESWGQDR
jgi:hypothetical protein